MLKTPILAAAALLIAAPAFAQSRNCGPRDAVVGRLAEVYGETRQSIGISANNTVVEVFASEETGTWTITVSNTAGVTCLAASGQSFESLSEELPTDDGDPT